MREEEGNVPRYYDHRKSVAFMKSSNPRKKLSDFDITLKIARAVEPFYVCTDWLQIIIIVDPDREKVHENTFKF